MVGIKKILFGISELYFRADRLDRLDCQLQFVGNW